MTKSALDKLFKEATGFHKTTCLLATRFTGFRDFDHDRHQPFPMMFRAADRTLVRTILKDHRADTEWMKDADSYFTSLIVNGAFSLELHLKHIYGLVEQQDVRGHDLHKLFLGLSDWTRTNLEAIFQAISSSQPLIRKQFDTLKSEMGEMGATLDWSLSTVLRESSRAFETWRYSYESTTVPCSFAGYGEAVFAMRTMSTQFKSKTPDP